MGKHNITPDILRELVDYNSITGALIWRERSEQWFVSRDKCAAWNMRYGHRPAFNTQHGKGYLVGSLFKKKLFAHRVAWAISHDEWPNHIDHINHTRDDNRLVNLRSVTQAENNKNQTLHSTNTSGAAGVSWFKALGKWHARIWHDNKTIHLGYFPCKSAAMAARRDAEMKYGYFVKEDSFG